MAKSISAGLLLFHETPSLKVLLAHPGGPYFAKKDLGSWSIPKGLVERDDEDLLMTAQREFCEETGYDITAVTEYLPLQTVTLKSGKQVHAWAFRGVWELGRTPISNTFEVEWPPRSGKRQAFPEIDRAEMFSLDEAIEKINERQRPFLHRLAQFVKTSERKIGPGARPA